MKFEHGVLLDFPFKAASLVSDESVSLIPLDAAPPDHVGCDARRRRDTHIHVIADVESEMEKIKNNFIFSYSHN